MGGETRDRAAPQQRYTAAGGVVVAGDRVLLLRRPSRGEIRLPKGHIRAGETREQAALRETREETGYVDLEVRANLGHQTVEFDYQGVHYVRDESCFLMGLRSQWQEERDPQEHPFEPEWFPWEEAEAALSFEAEREWLRRARRARREPSARRLSRTAAQEGEG